jgi:GT2 family glycosyltransferase
VITTDPRVFDLAIVVVLFGIQPQDRAQRLNALGSIGAAQLIVVANGAEACDWLAGHAADPSFTPIMLPGNPGLATAFNQALDRTQAPWLLLLDQDSELMPGWPVLITHATDAAPEVAIVTGSIVDIGTGSSTNRSLAVHGHAETLRLPLFQNSGTLVRRSAAVAVGGWCEDLHVDLVDAEFGIRLHQAGWRQLHVGQPVLGHHLGQTIELKVGPVRWHATNHSAERRRGMGRALGLIVRKHGVAAPEVRRVIRNMAGNVAGIPFEPAHRRRKLVSFIDGLKSGLRQKRSD